MRCGQPPCPLCGEGRCSGEPDHRCTACGAQIHPPDLPLATKWASRFLGWAFRAAVAAAAGPGLVWLTICHPLQQAAHR